jgi:hypothetical protein
MTDNAPLQERQAALRSLDDLPRWKLEDAKARFSEVVRLRATGAMIFNPWTDDPAKFAIF